MDHQIKILAEAITNGHVCGLVQTHVKSLAFDENTRHLEIYVDNAGSLHEFSEEKADHHLQKGLETVYGDDITYELKMHGETPHERDHKPGAGWNPSVRSYH